MGFKDIIKGATSFVPIVGDIVSGISASKEARKNRAFQERMSSTSHQREVTDLRKAGLNPILSATGGSGASTPSGNVAPVPDYGRGASSALLLKEQIGLLEAQRENLDSETRSRNQDYWMDKYFRPLERMQGLTSGRTAIAGSKAQIENTKQGLINLQEDLRTKQISNEDARRLLDRKLQDPEFRDWIDSAPYADRQAVKSLLSGDTSGSSLSKGLEVLIRILGGK